MKKTSELSALKDKARITLAAQKKKMRKKKKKKKKSVQMIECYRELRKLSEEYEIYLRVFVLQFKGFAIYISAYLRSLILD
jgi:hypothetical protein